jgi:hypothetical protein
MATVKNGLMRLGSSRTFIAEMLMAFLLAQLTLAVSRGGQHFCGGLTSGRSSMVAKVGIEPPSPAFSGLASRIN